MIIYPMPPEELDDDTLSKQIEAIAQVLCDSHYETLFKKCDGILKDLNKEQKDFWIAMPMKWWTSKNPEYVEWTEEVIKHYLDIGDNKGDDYFDSMRKFFKDWYLAGNGVHPALALNLAIPHTIKPFKSYEGQAGDIIFDLPERYKVKK